MCVCVIEYVSVCVFAGFDINFMDDVGQTLLNWAAAFGTYEMVSIIMILLCLSLVSCTGGLPVGT